MELYIQIRDGQPHEHPILGENFREAFPDVDVINLPPEFAKFVRYAEPHISPFEVNEGVTYEWIDGVVQDVWHIRPMTDEERAPVEQRLTNELNAIIADLKIKTQNGIDNATTDEIRQAWQDYSVLLNAWVLKDLLNPLVPQPPVILPNGKILTVTASGSAPNVIG